MILLPLPVQSVEPWRPLRKVSMVKLSCTSDTVSVDRKVLGVT